MTPINDDIRSIITTHLTESFIATTELANALLATGHALYQGRTPFAVTCLVRDAVPLTSSQRRVAGKAVRGYVRTELLSAL